ncbi:MAG: ABC transporter permease [Candidatus Sulfotelmatobacter sp.]|jgi:ABC-2 type transport system permease protein
MNTQSHAAPESSLASQHPAPVSKVETRPLYWSICRELWENRSVYVAPLAVASIYLLGYIVGLMWIPRAMHGMIAAHSTPQIVRLAMPYAHAGMLIMVTAFIVGVFYSLDSLHGERRDRSILFWKSLPVSDRTTVLSKASIPLVILPGLVLVITVALQLVMLLLTFFTVLASRGSTATLWAPPVLEMQTEFLYSLIVITLWHAPIYSYFILVSGWARRATFLWAVLPPIAIAAFEKIAFNTSYFGSMLGNRFFGFAADAFNLTDQNGVPIDPHFIPLSALTPGRFLSTPALWLGLIFAALCLAAAMRLRRYQGPI